MGVRGRGATAIGSTPTGDVEYPKPLPQFDLSKEARAIWDAVVKSKAPDWFTGGDIEVLADYCRLSAYGAVVDRRLRAITDDEAKTTQGRSDMMYYAAEQKRIATKLMMIAGKLRLVQSARMRTHVAETKVKQTISGLRPWQRNPSH